MNGNKKAKKHCIDNHKADSIEIANDYMLHVELDAVDEDGFKAYDYFYINYCPMCGRKLGD